MQENNKNSVKSPVRVRFAPSPTGIMHLGNIRTALMNFLFARQNEGTFVLRIEDTDPQRNYDPEGHQIISDLEWLGLNFDEGPVKGGPYEPYFQSKRTDLYQQHLDQLIEEKQVYRCFCTPEELEQKRQRQIMLKQPPRYDRACAKLSEEQVQQKLADNIPCIWRYQIDQSRTIEFEDLGHGTMKFDLEHFSDFPLTRTDGSFTFIFANCIDDIAMKINYVFRGDDHLSNTVNQVILYHAFKQDIPVFWHMPILCNLDGKKLSKRDFGFSINDLRNGGFLPEALVNYLTIIGGSFTEEIFNLETGIKEYPFKSISSTSQIKYDVEKLKWVNHKWIASLSPEQLLDRCMPSLEENYDDAARHDKKILTELMALVQSDLVTLHDLAPAVNFYFIAPTVTDDQILSVKPDTPLNDIRSIITDNFDKLDDPEAFMSAVKTASKAANIKLGAIMPVMRMILTGSWQGPHIGPLIKVLGSFETKKRFQAFFN